LKYLRLNVSGYYNMKHFIGFSNILSKALIFALLVWITFQPDPASAKIYKYKDDQGKTHYTDDASRIPLRYRDQGSMKKFRGVAEPTPTPDTPSQASASADGSEAKKDAGLSSREVGLVKKTIQVFKVGAALGDRYKSMLPNFSNGQGAVNAIQSGLPLKEGLARDLEGTKAPELQEALGFLKQSIAIDQQTTSVGAGLTRRIAGIFNRLVAEGKQQTAMIGKLEQALKNSEKKKAEARKRKEEEAKKEFERKQAETEKRREEAQKQIEE
jgi:hypothetical protein